MKGRLTPEDLCNLKICNLKISVTSQDNPFRYSKVITGINFLSYTWLRNRYYRSKQRRDTQIMSEVLILMDAWLRRQNDVHIVLCIRIWESWGQTQSRRDVSFFRILSKRYLRTSRLSRWSKMQRWTVLWDIQLLPVGQEAACFFTTQGKSFSMNKLTFKGPMNIIKGTVQDTYSSPFSMEWY